MKLPIDINGNPTPSGNKLNNKKLAKKMQDLFSEFETDVLIVKDFGIQFDNAITFRCEVIPIFIDVVTLYENGNIGLFFESTFNADDDLIELGNEFINVEQKALEEVCIKVLEYMD